MNDLYCPITSGHILTEKEPTRCPCGWPKKPCQKLHADLRDWFPVNHLGLRDTETSATESSPIVRDSD